MKTTPKTVWCLNSGYALHTDQTAGIVAALSQLYSLDVYWLQLKPHNRFVYFLLCWLLNVKNGVLSARYLPWFIKGNLPNNTPNYVVSAGVYSAAVNAWLATHHQAQNIWCGRTQVLKASLFAAVLAPRVLLNTQQQQSDNYIGLAVMPTTYNPATLSQPGDLTTWLLLFAGDSAGGAVHYSLSELSKLATNINTIATQQHVTWQLLSTGRATYQQEQVLNGVLAPSTMAAAYWAGGPQPPAVLALLASAPVVVISAAATHWLDQAVAAGKKVIVVKPDAFTLGANDSEVLAGYVRDKRVLLCNIDQLVETVGQLASLEVVGPEAQLTLVSQLAQNANLHTYHAF